MLKYWSTSESTVDSINGGRHLKPQRQLSSTRWYIEDAFFKPNGIRTHWKCPSAQTNALMSRARFVTEIAQNPDAMSRFMNHITASELSSGSLIRGNG